MKRFRKELQDFEKPPRTPTERALDIVKASMEREIAAKKNALATRERIVKAKSTVEYDSEAERLRSELDSLLGAHERAGSFLQSPAQPAPAGAEPARTSAGAGQKTVVVPEALLDT